MKDSTSYMLQINAAVFLFGFSGVFSKYIALPAVIITLGRVVFSSIVLFLVLNLRKQSLHIASQKDGLVFFAMGALLAAHWTMFIYAIQISSVAIGVITASTFPLFATFIEPLFFPERLKPINILFALIIVAGVFILVPMDALQGRVGMGVGYGMAASAAYAALVLLPVLLIIPVAITLPVLGQLFVFGVVCTALSHSLFINGLRGVTVQTASILDGLETIYGILFAFLLLGAVPTWREIIGGLVIVATAVVSSIYKEKSKAGHLEHAE